VFRFLCACQSAGSSRWCWRSFDPGVSRSTVRGITASIRYSARSADSGSSYSRVRAGHSTSCTVIHLLARQSATARGHQRVSPASPSCVPPLPSGLHCTSIEPVDLCRRPMHLRGPSSPAHAMPPLPHAWLYRLAGALAWSSSVQTSIWTMPYPPRLAFKTLPAAPSFFKSTFFLSLWSAAMYHRAAGEVEEQLIRRRTSEETLESSVLLLVLQDCLLVRWIFRYAQFEILSLVVASNCFIRRMSFFFSLLIYFAWIFLSDYVYG
jgi:hypothetical protein